MKQAVKFKFNLNCDEYYCIYEYIYVYSFQTNDMYAWLYESMQSSDSNRIKCFSFFFFLLINSLFMALLFCHDNWVFLKCIFTINWFRLITLSHQINYSHKLLFLNLLIHFLNCYSHFDIHIFGKSKSLTGW